MGEPVQPLVDALDTSAAEVVAGPAAVNDTTVEDATSILTTTGNAPTDVEVPRDPAGSVAVSGAGAQMKVDLPTGRVHEPERVAGNVAVFTAPGPAAASVAVQPRNTGALVMVIIRSRDEPQTYRFPVHLPPRGKLAPMAHGKLGSNDAPEEHNTTGYVILDRDNQGVGSIAAPWAQDSAGNPVRTWYTLEPGGTAVIQHVAHVGAHYPVVADPMLSVGCAWIRCSVWFSASVTRQLARAAPLGVVLFGQVAEKICAGLAHPVAKIVCAVMVAVVGEGLFGTLQKARAMRACLRVSFTPLLSLGNLSPMRFAPDLSKACDRGAQAGEGVAPVRPGSQAFVSTRGVTFTVVGGALFWIPNRDQLSRLTGEDDPWRPVRRISTRQVGRYRDLPADGTLFQEVSNSRVYYVSAGHCWDVDADQFERHRFDHKDIRKVPDRGLRQCPYAGPLPNS